MYPFEWSECYSLFDVSLSVYCDPRKQNDHTPAENGARGGTVSRKVAGSILDVVIDTFHSHNPSVLTMTLGSTEPVIMP
jgi:hypothetical protein